MVGSPCTEAERRRREAGVAKFRRSDGSVNITRAARHLGLSRSTLWSWFANRGAAPAPDLEGSNYSSRMDADHWRKRYATEVKEWNRERKFLETMCGVADMPVQPAEWLSPTGSSGKQAKAVISALVTDVHFGEVVTPEEISGINSYNPKVARQRLRRYFDAVCILGPRWGADCKLVGALCVIGGDLISGDIHEELRISNEGTSQEQAFGVAEELAGGIRKLADQFGKVHVAFVPGNHGRTTVKPFAKAYARHSWDTVAAKLVQQALHLDKRLTWQIPNARDARINVFGRTVLATHGDGMGTGGGQGFAGPILPIARGGKKVALQQFAAGQPYDLLVHGHYHHSANAPGMLSNGSFPGYTEYGQSLRAALEPPQQWAFLLHEKWWLRERCEVRLDEPKKSPNGNSVL